MKKIVLTLFAALFLLGTVVANVQAGTILPNTAQQQTGGFDDNWEVAYLTGLDAGIYGVSDPMTSTADFWTAVQAATFDKAVVYNPANWPMNTSPTGSPKPWNTSVTSDNGFPVSWIGPRAENTHVMGGSIGNVVSNDAGYYAFRLMLTGLPANVPFSFDILSNSDNSIKTVFYNGTPFSFANNGDTDYNKPPVDLSSPLFVTSPTGTVEFIYIVSNPTNPASGNNPTNYGNPAGLWISHHLENIGEEPVVPEPATLLLTSLGGLGLVAFRKRFCR